MIKNNKKILAIMQLPPPIHGQSIMNKFIYESKRINNEFNIKTIPLHFAKLDNIGQLSFYKIIAMIKYFFIILFQLIFFKPDAIYFTISPIGGAFYRDVFYVLLFKLFSKKIIFHLHGKGIKNKTKNKFNQLLYNFVFKNSNIIHLSECLYKDLQNITVHYNKFVVENGIALEKELQQNKKNEIPQILYISNIKKTKGILDLIKACEIIYKKDIKFNLKIVGGITNSISKKFFYSIIKKNEIKNIITYYGSKYGQKKFVLLNSSDIFVFPTYYPNECFPLVILEAMQSGLPVISTYEGAIPDIVDDGETGFLVRQRNVIQLAEKIEFLIKNKKIRENMGVAGKKKFLNKYTLDKFENNMITTFNEILNSSRQKQ